MNNTKKELIQFGSKKLLVELASGQARTIDYWKSNLPLEEHLQIALSALIALKFGMSNHLI